MSRHLGLIIGVNHYQDSTFQPLRFAENDARALAQWLVNSKGGNWSPPDVQLVQSLHATKELVESLSSQICIQKAEAGDVVLLYLASHAFINEQSGEGYLALNNSRYQDTSTCLHLPSFVQNILMHSPAAHILLILDCFQDGQIWNMRRTSPFDAKPLLGPMILNTLQSHPNHLIMCSCRGNEHATESGDHNLGLLMNRMIIGLNGPAADTATGVVTLNNLHAYLFNSLGEQQRPQLFGVHHTPMILIGELPPVDHSSISSLNNDSPVGVSTMASSSTIDSFVQQPGQFAKVTHENLPPLPMQPSLRPIDKNLYANPAQNQSLVPQIQQLLTQAQQQFQGQNYGEAFNTVERVLQVAPDEIPALILKGQLLGTAGRYVEAGNVIDHLLQVDPNNAIGWSMRAVVLSNTAQYQSALEAVERSLELDGQNPETYAIKTNIMASQANSQSLTETNPNNDQKKKRDTTTSTNLPSRTSGQRAFFLGLGLHILGLIIGLAGIAILLATAIPAPVGLFIASIGLTILCVNAMRGAFRFGASYLGLTLIFLVLLGGLLGVIYKVALTKIADLITLHPSMMNPTVFALIWLAIAAALPFILSLIGWIAGIGKRMRIRNQ